MLAAARVAAAIEILDLIADGDTPEKALTGWGRTHRFAGSKDRAAIRDHVFQALRCRTSFAWRGGANTGRGIMLGATRADQTVDGVFTGEGHAPSVVLEFETGQDIADAPRDIRLDMPAWVLPHFDGALGDQADAVLSCLQSRAAVFLRINLAKTTREDAMAVLAEDGIMTRVVDHIHTALQVIENERRVALSVAYLEGLVELQDASSQAAINALDVSSEMRVLDYCAGGGGKALALAATGARVVAHDIDPRRMVDLGPRAQRAGVQIETVATDDLENCEPFDLILCDAPCSGSGTWRRTPNAKWELSPARLVELTTMQDDVLDGAARLLRVGGTLAFATCSVFDVENSVRIQSFTDRNLSFASTSEHRWLPNGDGDGFFLATMTRVE